jgi:stage II sporulation protein R
LQESAEWAVAEAGYSYPIRIELGKEEYPTKNYESACFPAGEYLSLRVLIGEGEGQNWWCVLFPPLCVSAASESDGSVEVGLYGDQYAIVTETEDIKYKIRFKLLEAIEKAVN